MLPLLDGGAVGVALATAAGVVLAGGGSETSVGAGAGDSTAGAAAGESALPELPAPPHATPLAAEKAMSAARPSRSIGMGRTPFGGTTAPSQNGHRESDFRT